MIRSSVKPTILVAVLSALLWLPAGAAALATRTWVSGTGSDSNPCTRAAPCQTFAEALSSTAAGGEIDVLDPGGFGTVTINKSVTIRATGTDAGVLVSGTDGITINAGDTDTVTLEGLDIDGLGPGGPPGVTGVDVEHAGSVRLENDEVYGFGQSGVGFEPSAPTTSGVPAPSLFIDNSSIHDNAGAGVLAVPPAGGARVTIEHSQIENNGCGLAAGASAAVFETSTCGTSGTGGTGTVTVASDDTSFSGNTGAGVQSDGSTVTNDLVDDVVTGNGTGLQELSGGHIVFIGPDNSVFGNGTDGTPTAVLAAAQSGPAGANGINGANGRNGSNGAAGRVELVTCRTVTKTVTKKVHGKKRKVKTRSQKCTGKLVSGTVKFTVSGKVEHATLSRAGHVYASGNVRTRGQLMEGSLKIRGKVRRGRYTLTLFKRGKAISHRVVVED